MREDRTASTPGSPGSTTTRYSASAWAIVAVVVGAVPAAVLGLDIAWIVVAAGSSVLVIAPGLARRQTQAITAIARPAAVRVSEGRTSTLELQIQSQRTARDVLLDASLVGDSTTERERAPRLALHAVRPDGPHTLDCPVRLPRRGRHDGLLLSVSSSFPFGFVTATRTWNLAGPVTVHPRVFDRGDRRLQRVIERVADGVDESRHARSSASSRGLPVGVRGGRPGDPARDIAWRASARSGRWLTQERAPTQEARVQIDLVNIVHGRGAGGTLTLTNDARTTSADGIDASRHPSPYSLIRRDMAFEWAVRTTASVATGLCLRGREVTTRYITPDAGASLQETLERAARGTCRVAAITLADGASARAHLEALTDVQPAAGGAAADGAAPRRTRRHARGAVTSIVIVPIVRTGAEFSYGATGRATGSIVVGVDAVGRIGVLDLPGAGAASSRGPRRASTR